MGILKRSPLNSISCFHPPFSLLMKRLSHLGWVCDCVCVWGGFTKLLLCKKTIKVAFISTVILLILPV